MMKWLTKNHNLAMKLSYLNKQMPEDIDKEVFTIDSQENAGYWYDVRANVSNDIEALESRLDESRRVNFVIRSLGLSDRYKKLLYFYYVKNMSLTNIAKLENMSRQAIWSKLHTLQRRLSGHRSKMLNKSFDKIKDIQIIQEDNLAAHYQKLIVEDEKQKAIKLIEQQQPKQAKPQIERIVKVEAERKRDIKLLSDYKVRTDKFRTLMITIIEDLRYRPEHFVYYNTCGCTKELSALVNFITNVSTKYDRLHWSKFTRRYICKYYWLTYKDMYDNYNGFWLNKKEKYFILRLFCEKVRNNPEVYKFYIKRIKKTKPLEFKF